MNHSFEVEEMEERAALYALGALSQHEARAFEEHLAEGCESCEALLKDFESTVEQLAFDAPEAMPPAATRDKLMARLAAESGPTSPAPTSQHDNSQPFIVRADEGVWRKMYEGIVYKQLFADPVRNTVTTLVKMQAGARIPMHRHRGVEECYVIEGDVSANNEIFRAGDYICEMEGSIHPPISTVNGALLLIVSPESFEVLEH